MQKKTSSFSINNNIKHKSSIENLTATQLKANSNIPQFAKGGSFDIVNLLNLGNVDDLSNILKSGTSISSLTQNIEHRVTDFKFPNGNYIKDSKNIPGIGKPFSISQFEKIHNRAYNLGEQLNPLSLLKNSNFYDLPDDESLKNINLLLHEVYNLNSDIIKKQQTLKDIHYKFIPYLDLNNDKVKLYKKLYDRYFTLFNTSFTISDNANVFEQINELKTYLFSLYLSISDISHLPNLPNGIKDELKQFNTEIFEFRNKLENINANYDKWSISCYQSIKNYNNTLGIFKELSIEDIIYKKTEESIKLYEKIKNHPILNFVRPSYLKSSHSSVSKLATDFGNKGDSTIDKIDEAESNIPIVEMAASEDGYGDKIQNDDNVETISKTESETNITTETSTKCVVGPLTESQWEIYRNTLGQYLSGNNYAKVNLVGFCGRWQFENTPLIDSGLVKPGTSTRNLKVDSVWTGYKDISSRSDWLNNKNNIQDSELIVYTKRNYKTLLKLNVIDANTQADEVGAWLATAHLNGCGNAKKLKNGQDTYNAFGESTTKYYDLMKDALDGTNNENIQPSVAAGTSTISDAPSFVFPPSNRAPMYPHNNVRETESGHIVEYDDSPGSERVNIRHRLGGGTEILSDGIEKHFVVSDKYEAIMGSDYILVNGNCNIIVMGDVGVRANGSMNIDVGEDLNIKAGGNLNFNIQGDIRENISGSKNSNISGDTAQIYGGFYKQSSTGDTQIDGSSVNVISRDGNSNIFSTNDTVIASNGEVNISSQSDINIGSKNNINFSSDTLSSFSNTLNQASNEIYCKSDAFNIDSSSVSINSSSTIQVKPEVSHSIFSNVSFTSQGHSPVTKPPYSTQNVNIDDSKSSIIQSDLNSDAMNNLGDYEAFDSDYTQSYMRGDSMSEYMGSGNKNGFKK